MADVDAVPLSDVPEPAHVAAIAAMTNYAGAISAFPHLKDLHTESPTKWLQRVMDMLPLYGPEWNDPIGTSTAAALGSPHNWLCAGIVTLIDSEKRSGIVRGWVTTGLPDPDDPRITSPYADAPSS